MRHDNPVTEPLQSPLPFLLGMHVTTGEVMTSVECRQAIGQKLADVMGVSLYMRLYAIPPLNPLLSRSRILLSPTPCHARRGAIGIEKWCTPVQSHSFPRLSDPRGCRVPLSSPSSPFTNSSDSPRYPLIAIKIIRTLFLFTLSYTSDNFFPFHLVSWDFKFLQWG